MRKLLFFAFLFFAPSLYPCKHKEQLVSTTNKLHRVVQRIEERLFLKSEAIHSGELIDTYIALYYELCDDCKKYADLHTEPSVKKIMDHFGLE